MYSKSETVAISTAFQLTRSRPAAGNRVAGRWGAASVVGPKSAAVAADGAQVVVVVAVAVPAHTMVIAIFSCAACRSASSSIWRSPSRTVFWRWPGLVEVGRLDCRRHLHRHLLMTDRSPRTHRSYTWWDRCCSRHRPSTGWGNRPAPWSLTNLWISYFVRTWTRCVNELFDRVTSNRCHRWWAGSESRAVTTVAANTVVPAAVGVRALASKNGKYTTANGRN